MLIMLDTFIILPFIDIFNPSNVENKRFFVAYLEDIYFCCKTSDFFCWK